MEKVIMKDLVPMSYKMIDSLKKDFKKDLDYDCSNWRYIHAVIELRHKLAHFGIPNIVGESKKDPKFLEKIIWKGDYKEAQKYFKKADEILKKCWIQWWYYIGLY
jgi:hypothetical protein